MCGICGVIGLEHGERGEEVVRRMTQALWHRGPDEDGFFAAPFTALGMRRLSIIDLPGGHQPVFNETRDVALVYNGEIYNFQQLRRTLESRGHRFRTHSDTEVVVHAYEEWGELCVREFRGMFAFALWDGRAGDAARDAKLFLARDRLGIKPLYYTVVNGALYFSSEVRSLIASGCVNPKLAADSLEAYLLFGSVAEPSTLVEGVFSVPPGHSVLVHAGSPDKIAPKRYWSYADAALLHTTDPAQTFAGAAKQLRPLLEETVQDHLIADVPVGVFLSSGLDSTALVALGSRAQSDLHTFTVIFPEHRYSEAAISRETAKHFKTRHEEILLTPDEMLAQLNGAVGALDQPTMDGLNTYFVSWAAHKAGLKVALSGLGGDEVFGGYSTFATTPRAAFAARAGRWVPGPLRRLTGDLAVKFANRDAVRKAAAAWSAPRDFPHAYYFTRMLFTPARVRRLLAPLVSARKLGAENAGGSNWRGYMGEMAQQAMRLDSFTAVSCLELQSYTVNTLLRDTDSVSMAQSLEVRVPFLDHRLVEFVAQLPKSAKYRPGVPKSLLVEALAGLLPPAVVQQTKRTFTLPWDLWLHGPLGVRVSHDLQNLAPALQEHLNPRAVRDAWKSFASGQTNWSRPWSLYVLNEWARAHLTAAHSPEASRAPAVRPAAMTALASDPQASPGRT